ncbi:NPCBM/NEW2 domain-containing protein [Chitinophaga arvensicola]|uniref:NPCBM/NEW2 domain-containing protein n=1 Tax=Chitinophaga arvensicola TaxID=29529 RepID=A0A1I0S9M3_9BACT|nr:NPCBM/NEW2 domain-containing protein [Chitinophaga arvensicola]
MTVSLLGCSMLSLAQQPQFLSGLNNGTIRQDIFSPVANASMTGRKMKMNQKIYENGISVHAPASGIISLKGKGIRFVADIGVDDKDNRNLEPAGMESLTATDGTKTFYHTDKTTNRKNLTGVGRDVQSIAPGSIVFTLLGDDKQILSTGILRQGDKPVHVEVDISGIDALRFSVTDGGNGISGDIADLANAAVIMQPGFKPELIDEHQLSKNKPHENGVNSQLSALLLSLPVAQPSVAATDWLIQKPAQKAAVSRIGNQQVILSNGLISRTFYVGANMATTSIRNLVTGEEYLRAIKPEADVMIDSINYPVGGLTGQIDQAYLLPDWLDKMNVIPHSFLFKTFKVSELKQKIPWTSKRWLASSQWKASGKELTCYYEHPDLKGISVAVHYEIYDGIPLISKWLEINNQGDKKIQVNHFTAETIAFSEPSNSPSGKQEWLKPDFHLENDYAFDGFTYEGSDQSIFWQTDKTYTSQADYNLMTPCVVKSMPAKGPEQILEQGQHMVTFNTYFLALDGTDRERNGLSQRKMYRTLAPWATENPIFLHLTSTNPEVVKQAVDQCKTTGYEMIILSFGSGLNMEDTSARNIEKFRSLAAYAHAKGIEIGGYSLFSSRSIDAENDVIDVTTGKPGGARFGNAPCLGSKWGIAYLQKINKFFAETGFDLLEHDGPYPGDFCASKDHPGHHGYGDSQWNQWKESIVFYKALRKKGIYLNLPDFYFLSGSNKVSVGYKEVNWSLPREQQLVLGRQNNYDGTWTRTPAMNWTFVPLVEYHGGGAAATLEPLADHLDAYEAHMKQNYGAGIQACYRGNRLYDTEATRALVIKEVAHYKKYREILNADIIHLQRPTGRDWDGFMHADPQLKQKAFAMFFNPLSEPITRTIKLPLYYAGLSNNAKISIQGAPARHFALNAKKEAIVNITIPANSSTWLVVE